MAHAEWLSYADVTVWVPANGCDGHVDEMLRQARLPLERLTPHQAWAAMQGGAAGLAVGRIAGHPLGTAGSPTAVRTLIGSLVPGSAAVTQATPCSTSGRQRTSTWANPAASSHFVSCSVVGT
jgi:hypothetical protein